VLGRGGVVGVDVAPGVWHTTTALTDTAICFEVKPGPYDAATDKEFAPWAPREGDPAAAAYLAGLVSALRLSASLRVAPKRRNRAKARSPAHRRTD